MPMPQADRARETAHARPMPPPSVVAVAGWLLPGAGYWLIGQRSRGLVAGITVIILFTAGTLIGGVRAIQVPGYGEGGGALYTWYETRTTRDNQTVRRAVIAEEPPANFSNPTQGTWVLTDFRALLAEVGNKPWSICQVLAGPLGIGGGAWSVIASRPAGADGMAAGVLSHSRVNELGVLYTAVAGMLNLLVMIDAAARAGWARPSL